ncbi:hypothetical protein IV102_25715 [bacterium]|nr:hypothetical protein [bacterium]
MKSRNTLATAIVGLLLIGVTGCGNLSDAPSLPTANQSSVTNVPGPPPVPLSKVEEVGQLISMPAGVASKAANNNVTRSSLAVFNPNILPEAVGVGAKRATQIDLFGDKSLEVELDPAYESGENAHCWTGKVVGDPGSAVVVGEFEGAYAGIITTKDASYGFRQVDDEHVLVEQGSKLSLCGLEVSADQKDKSDESGNEAAPPPPPLTPVSFIDVSFGYTGELLQARSRSSIGAVATAGLNYMNLALSNNQLTYRMRLASLIRVDNYAETGVVNSAVLDDLYNAKPTINPPTYRNDGLGNFVKSSDAAGADLVCLLVNRSSGNVGIAKLPKTEGQLSQTSDYRYTVVYLNHWDVVNTIAHEFGHNFGCRHERKEGEQGTDRVRPYAAGFLTPSGRGDIMTYAGSKVIPAFSSPNMVFDGERYGASDADNKRVINDTATYIDAHGDSAKFAPFSTTLPAGWTMFAMPFSRFSHFNLDKPGAVKAAWEYQAASGTYTQQVFSGAGFTTDDFLTFPKNFKACWVYCTEPVNLQVDGSHSSGGGVFLNGDSPIDPYLGKDISQGWNMVGCPLPYDVASTALEAFNVPLPTAVANSQLGNGGWMWNGQNYESLNFSSGSLGRFRAAWIYASANGKIRYRTH